MTEQYIDNVTKGESYTLKGRYTRSDDYDARGVTTSGATLNAYISKDGGNFSSTTNTPSQIGDGSVGAFTLLLTAEEMDADDIIVYCTSSYANVSQPIFFITTGTGAIPETAKLTYNIYIATTVVRALEKGFSISKTSLNQNGFNYYGLNKQDKQWIIIKENILGSPITYNQNREVLQAFETAWSNRTSLIYDSSVKIK